MIRTLNDFLHNKKGILLAGLLLALLAGCGGSDNGNPAGDPVGDPGPSAPSDDGNDDDPGNDDDGSGTDDDDPGGDNGAGDPTDDNPDDGSDDDADDGNDDDLDFEMFQAASVVIGQVDFTGGGENQDGGPDANTLYMPLGGVGYAPGEDVLFIADSENARVLGFLGIPDMNNANADFVLGQSDFTSIESEISPGGMASPESISTTGGQLMITDTDFNRVTVYEGVPASGGIEPVLVVGQPSLNENTGAVCDQSTLLHPHAHFLAPPDANGNRKFLVADAAHNRVLVWNDMPSESGAPADLVLGQSSFENCSFRQPENFRHPAAVWTDGQMLIVADSEKHRILIWNTFPTEGFQAPDVILGQTDMLHTAPNDDNQDGVPDGNVDVPDNCHLPDCHLSDENNGNATARTLFYPRDFEVFNGKLYVADMNNQRVLVWNSIPTESFTPADVVIGQENFTSNAPNAGQAQPNARGFDQPVGVNIVGNQLFVTDWKNSRVMIFEGQ